MKNKFLLFTALLALLSVPKINYGQAPSLGSTANYVLFSTNGSLANTATSTFTGDIGTNNGTASNFTSVSGVVQIMNASSALCATDLLSLYNQLNTTSATLIAVPTLGNNQVITAGAYSITTAASLNGTLTLDAQSNTNAVFIIQIQGAFATNAGAVVNLINGALACNVFWKVEGAVTMAAGTLFKGTIIANNALIDIGAGTVLEGRAMTTAGAVAVNGSTLYITTCSNPSPTITTQPVSQSVCIGSSASFSVTAIGAGLTYQWRRGTTNLVNGGAISGATSSVLTISPMSVADLASDYNVVVNGTFLPSVTSINVSLNSLTAAAITAIASSQTVCAGGSANFSVTATGDGLTYQWRKGSVNLTNTGNTSGVNTSVLILNPVSVADAATDYNVIITGSCAPSASSANVSLDVNSSPSITTQPVAVSICAGANATFVVGATGTGISYQWRKGTTNLTNSGNISGVTTANLLISSAIAADAATDYNVVVSGSCTPNQVSTNVALIINTAPVILTQASSQTVCAGLAVNFSVSASGSGLTYQWRKGTTNLSNAGSISGATSSNLSINPLVSGDAATNYNVIISGSCAPSVTSTNVSLTVNVSPSITSQPLSQTLCAGSTANFSVVANGTSLIYQWRKGIVNMSNGGTISGATSSALTIAGLSTADAATDYNVIVIGLCSPSANSFSVTLVVSTSPSITSQPVSQTVCAGSNVTIPVTCTGSGLTYQWRKGTTNLANGGTISGATSAQLVLSSVSSTDAATNYNVIISGSCAPSVTSTNMSLLVNTAAVILAQPVSQTICANSPVNFIVTTSGSGLTYQWRKGTVNISNGGTTSGATNSVLTISTVNASDVASNYNVVITSLCGPTLISSNVALAVNFAPSITAQPVSQTVCAGGTVSLDVLASGTNLTYQWRKGTTPLNNGNNVTGANSANLTFNPANLSDAATNYNVVIHGQCLPDQISILVSLTVGTSPIIAMIPGKQEVCIGSAVSFPVNVSGAGLTYQWRKGSSNLTNNATVSGVNTATLSINPVSVSDAGTDYNLVITGQCSPSKTTANMALVVNSTPIITLQPNNQMAYIGSSVSFSVKATGSGLTYQWRRGTTNLVNGGNISGAQSPILTINPVFAMDTAGNYNVVISGPCSQDIVSNNAILWVCYCPEPTALREEKAVGTVNVYPNPFSNTLNVIVDKESIIQTCEIIIYSISGTEVLRSTVTKELTVIDTNEFISGAYFYRIVIGDKVIQSGKLIAQH